MSERIAYLILRVVPDERFACDRYPVGVYSEESLEGLRHEKGFPVVLATARASTFELAAHALDQAMVHYASAGLSVNGSRGRLVNASGSLLLPGVPR